MAKKNVMDKELQKKIIDLKIELLKQNQKRKSIKKEIARSLTMNNSTKLGGKK